MEKDDDNIVKKRIDILNELEKLSYHFFNFNDERIGVARIYQKYLAKEDISLIKVYCNTFKVKSFGNEFIDKIKVKYWLKFASNVINNISLGFPIVIKVINCDNKTTLLY